MGLVDEILHYLVGLYREQATRQSCACALDWLERAAGQPGARSDAAALRRPLSRPWRSTGARSTWTRTSAARRRRAEPPDRAGRAAAALAGEHQPGLRAVPGAVRRRRASGARRPTRQLVDELRAFFDSRSRRSGPEQQNLIDDAAGAGAGLAALAGGPARLHPGALGPLSGRRRAGARCWTVRLPAAERHGRDQGGAQAAVPRAGADPGDRVRRRWRPSRRRSARTATGCRAWC